MTGCATLSREQCQNGDWYGIGLADGRAGEPETRVNEHNKSCAEFGILVNSKLYFQGRAKGLADYCRLENAIDTGLHGRRYHHVCPSSIDAVFNLYNSAAYEVYSLRRKLETLDYQISDKENELRRKDLSDDKRSRLRLDLRDLYRERDRWRDDLATKENYLDLLMYKARSR